MWTWIIRTGELQQNGTSIDHGYSGAPDDKNNPADVSVKDHGPIPSGKYTICAPRDTTTHGPYVLPLQPDPSNEMYGRGSFLIHGDKIGAPGTASEGCIILSRPTREKIWQSNDPELTVTA